MPYSKYNRTLVFDEKQSVISLINTKKGISGVFGGHVKIVVESIQRSGPELISGNELFVGEYHIMEAERIPDGSWVPQALRNTKCKYTIGIVESNQYTLDDSKYDEVKSVSWIAPRSETHQMIKAIKEEKGAIDMRQIDSQFQYAGQWCFYSYQGGHNCTTWAEEKLAIARVGNGILWTDSSKAMPAIHVGMGKCIIL
jgi:hypothetical protein